MRNFSDEIIEKTKMHISCGIRFFFFKYRAVYEIMWKIWRSQTGHT